jgi:hypothetical protein
VKETFNIQRFDNILNKYKEYDDIIEQLLGRNSSGSGQENRE